MVLYYGIGGDDDDLLILLRSFSRLRWQDTDYEYLDQHLTLKPRKRKRKNYAKQPVS